MSRRDPAWTALSFRRYEQSRASFISPAIIRGGVSANGAVLGESIAADL
ncbi:MAG: hypothetical protein IPP80_13845 [Ignavibacteria bacterium]|nr:hypothetical protein [Ignavibacteria bacterium]